MISALGTLLFFAVTPVFANRAAHLLGSTRANFYRLVLAVALLGGWAHVAGRGLGGAASGWFFAGGIVGFGIGGIAMFQCLPRLGSNIATLIVQCLSAIAAVATEWAWLGTKLGRFETICVAVTLVGVALGLMPQSMPRVSPRLWLSGLLWALVSAIGQGVGAVISRKAFAVAMAAHQPVDPGTAAYERAVGGVLVATLALAVIRWKNREPAVNARAAAPWVAANALTGPVLGVTCYQWALRSTPAAIVQPIVAAAPLLTIPFAMKLEGSRPRALYYVGSLLAIAGVTGLLLRK